MLVEVFGSDVRLVRPNDSAEFRIEASLPKPDRVSQRFEHQPPEDRLHVDLAPTAIGKIDFQHVRLNNFHVGDVDHDVSSISATERRTSSAPTISFTTLIG